MGGRGLVLLTVAGIGIPTVLYADRHPDASPRFLIPPAIAFGVLIIVYFIFGIRWRQYLQRERATLEVESAT